MPLPMMLLAAAIAGEPAYELEIQPSRRVRAVLTTKIHAPKLKAQEWIFYVPKPPATAGQEVHSARLSPDGRDSREASDARRPMLLARVAVANDRPKDAIEFRAEYDVTLKQRRLVRLKEGRPGPRVEPLPVAEKKLALATSRECDFNDPAFRDWLADHKLNRKPGESDIDHARRVFLFIKGNFQYEYTATLDRRASRVCKHRRSDCGGLSGLFVAILRANDVPARELVGRWAASEKPGEKVGGTPYAQQHAKAEFFADGVGWVPIDMASAVLYDKTADGLAYFGNDPGDFLAMHLDSDLILDTIHFGRETMEVLQGGAVWVRGSGAMDGFSQEESWKVEKAAR